MLLLLMTRYNINAIIIYYKIFDVSINKNDIKYNMFISAQPKTISTLIDFSMQKLLLG